MANPVQGHMQKRRQANQTLDPSADIENMKQRFEQQMTMKHRMHQHDMMTKQHLHRQKIMTMINQYLHGGGDRASLLQAAQHLHRQGNPELAQMYAEAANGWSPR